MRNYMTDSAFRLSDLRLYNLRLLCFWPIFFLVFTYAEKFFPRSPLFLHALPSGRPDPLLRMVRHSLCDLVSLCRQHGVLHSAPGRRGLPPSDALYHSHLFRRSVGFLPFPPPASICGRRSFSAATRWFGWSRPFTPTTPIPMSARPSTLSALSPSGLPPATLGNSPPSCEKAPFPLWPS